VVPPWPPQIKNNEDHSGAATEGPPLHVRVPGTRKPLPVDAERAIFELPIIYINGAKQGFLSYIDSAR
jgi:hypothetical protein